MNADRQAFIRIAHKIGLDKIAVVGLKNPDKQIHQHQICFRWLNYYNERTLFQVILDCRKKDYLVSKIKASTRKSAFRDNQ
jgi:hypothetical protein